MSAFSSPASILITGATGGIGRALALAYAAPEKTLILHGRDVTRLALLQRECEQRGATVIPLILDLTDSATLMTTLDALARDTPIDLAIINAGTTNIIGESGETWPDIERVFNINLRAAMATISALLPPMRQRRHGQVALISSLSAYVGLPVTPAYCASKAALKSYGEALRGWLAPQGIAVNVVLPGFVETPMSDQFPTSKPFLVSPENAARRIKAGLARNQGRISFPWPLAFGMWWLSVLPAAWSQWMLRMAGFGGAQRKD
jgi:short-subunit dehydrogenase